MESGEIRKNTRLNIYSDEEAQVRNRERIEIDEKE